MSQTNNLSLPLFNAAEGRRQRDLGMAISASYPGDAWVLQARTIGEIIAAKQGSVTIDQILMVCPRPKDVSPNATGSIFRGKRWKCIGFAQSSQVQRHAGLIRRWALCSDPIPRKQ